MQAIADAGVFGLGLFSGLGFTRCYDSNIAGVDFTGRLASLVELLFPFLQGLLLVIYQGAFVLLRLPAFPHRARRRASRACGPAGQRIPRRAGAAAHGR